MTRDDDHMSRISKQFQTSSCNTNNCSFSDVSKRIFALTEGHRADVSASNSIAIVSTGEKKNEVYPPYAVSRSAQPNTTTITDKGRMNKLKEDGP